MSKIGPVGFGVPTIFQAPRVNVTSGSQFPHRLHREGKGFLEREVENAAGTANHPPNCSVNLLINLFKSLSVFRASSIFSTECSTVV
jgi:hypothetical protein